MNNTIATTDRFKIAYVSGHGSAPNAVKSLGRFRSERK